MANVLIAKTRNDLKKSTTKFLRQSGQVPAIVYGKQVDNKSVSVTEVEFVKLMRDVGRNGIISLNIEGDTNHKVMVYDFQVDPIKSSYEHIDFFEIDMKSEIEADVPVKLVGDAPAEKEGGVVSQLLYEVKVRCLPADIPEEIEVDISNVQLADTIQISDVRQTISVEVLNDDDETIVTVQAPSAVEEETTEDGTEQSTDKAKSE